MNTGTNNSFYNNNNNQFLKNSNNTSNSFNGSISNNFLNNLSNSNGSHNNLIINNSNNNQFKNQFSFGNNNINTSLNNTNNSINPFQGSRINNNNNNFNLSSSIISNNNNNKLNNNNFNPFSTSINSSIQVSNPLKINNSNLSNQLNNNNYNFINTNLNNNNTNNSFLQNTSNINSNINFNFNNQNNIKSNFNNIDSSNIINGNQDYLGVLEMCREAKTNLFNKPIVNSLYQTGSNNALANFENSFSISKNKNIQEKLFNLDENFKKSIDEFNSQYNKYQETNKHGIKEFSNDEHASERKFKFKILETDFIKKDLYNYKNEDKITDIHPDEQKINYKRFSLIPTYKLTKDERILIPQTDIIKRNSRTKSNILPNKYVKDEISSYSFLQSNKVKVKSSPESKLSINNPNYISDVKHKMSANNYKSKDSFVNDYNTNFNLGSYINIETNNNFNTNKKENKTSARNKEYFDELHRMTDLIRSKICGPKKKMNNSNTTSNYKANSLTNLDNKYHYTKTNQKNRNSASSKRESYLHTPSYTSIKNYKKFYQTPFYKNIPFSSIKEEEDLTSNEIIDFTFKNENNDINIGSNNSNYLNINQEIDEDVLRFEFNVVGFIYNTISVKIHKSNTGKDLKEIILQELKLTYPHLKIDEISLNDVFIISPLPIKDDECLLTYPFLKNTNYFTVEIAFNKSISDSESETLNSLFSSQQKDIYLQCLKEDQESTPNNYKKDLIKTTNFISKFEPANDDNIDYFPKCKNFTLCPSIESLQDFKITDLKCLQNLIIKNEHGLIIFEEPVDVTYTDIDKVIKFQKEELLLYDGNPPLKGTGLNSQAFVKMFNFEIPDEAYESETAYKDFIQETKQMVETSGVRI